MMQSSKTAEAVSVRATGVLFFAAFGSLWLCNGLSAMHRLNFVTGAAIATIFVALVVPALTLIKSAAKATRVEIRLPESQETRRVFVRVNRVQWITIIAAVVLFNVLQKQEFLVPVITFIVGLHLFPLARIFEYPAYKVTGTLLVLWAIMVVTFLTRQALLSVGAIGTGVILLGSATCTVTSASRALKSKPVSGRLSPARA